ncbi:ficolin-2 [Elysia marginata]|uniref:Ficolin-2 n=1 Tax=Elysia marginata TaxID=1093978 RepID=A0AAV4IXN6_9GAST|nr:ficolin-2 [Elysia marginata]
MTDDLEDFISIFLGSQRRVDGGVDFNKSWAEYRHGFGEPSGDFWLGNDALHEITSKHPSELRIDMRIDGQDVFARYDQFKVENESDNYRLRLGNYSGTVTTGESPDRGFSYSNGSEFSTFDRDNDEFSTQNCALNGYGGWWFKQCYYALLTGPTMVWYSEQRDSWLYADRVEMKIRPFQEG